MNADGYSVAAGTYVSERGHLYYYYTCERCGKDANGYRCKRFRGHVFCNECKKKNQKEYVLRHRDQKAVTLYGRLCDAFQDSPGILKTIQTIYEEVMDGE